MVRSVLQADTFALPTAFRNVTTERASPIIKDEDSTENVTLSRLFSFAKFVKRTNVLRAELLRTASHFKLVFIMSVTSPDATF